MGKTTITISLNDKEIDRAIREIKAYKKAFQQKVDTFRRRIAEEIASSAELKFGSSTMEHTIQGASRKPSVQVSVDERGNVSVVVADGEDAVWCEFGAGVYFNGSVGSSPNPYGNKLGFTIGSYGKGYGKGKAWGYYDETGELVITRGTPASMPMYNSAKEVAKKAIKIAGEVFR